MLDELRAGGVDGALFDLGVSSPQLDDPRRGFSFRFDAPLDMRMDPSQGGSALEWLERAEEAEIREVLSSYGEERFAKQIAKAIVAARRGGPLRRTGELAAVVAAAVRTREPGQDPATRTFQAIRIHVNQELEELSLSFAASARRAPAPGSAGRDQLSLPRGPDREEIHARGCAARRPRASSAESQGTPAADAAYRRTAGKAGCRGDQVQSPRKERGPARRREARLNSS